MNARQQLYELASDCNRLTGEERTAISRAIDFIEHLEINHTAGNTGDDDTPSRMALGNVDVALLDALGFDTQPVWRCEHCGETVPSRTAPDTCPGCDAGDPSNAIHAEWTKQ